MSARPPSAPLHSGWFVAGLLWALVAYGQPPITPAFAESTATPAAARPAARATVRYAMQPPHIAAASAILIDRVTGEVLFELKPDEQRVPASTTKIMTALLALENSDPATPVVVSPLATQTGGSRLHISAGEEIPMADMIEAMMIRSGNDAAAAIAETIGGDQAHFIEMMNIRAAELGMTNTRFQNPHGMPMTGGGNLSTARDLAKLAQAALDSPRFCSIVQKSKVVYPSFGIRSAVEFTNTNRLLEEFPLTTGIKTGYTDLARHCLVASARFRDREVIGVILGAEKATIRPDMVRLFDYGLNVLADDYWIYRKFSLEPQVYPFEAPPAPVMASASTVIQ